MKNPSLRCSALLLLLLAAAAACSRAPASMEQRRAEMVRTQVLLRGIDDPRIQAAFRTVPREEYVLPQFREHAYDDVEAPIGYEQTIDRAYENALMLKALKLSPEDVVLEVGTGSGYLASIMAQLAKQVFTIDIDPRFAKEAAARVARLGYGNITVKEGDGFVGWPEHAPFNAIVMTCSPPQIPKPLIEQLSGGGRIVLPLGGDERFQELVLYVKRNGRLVEQTRLSPAEFVPMQGIIKQKP